MARGLCVIDVLCLQLPLIMLLKKVSTGFAFLINKQQLCMILGIIYICMITYIIYYLIMFQTKTAKRQTRV